MRAIIDDPNFIFSRINVRETEKSEAALAEFRGKVIEHIRSFFKWSEYGPEWRHLVYYVELDGVAHIYVNGYLMTEEEFEKDVATREGVGYVGAFHRR